MMTVKTVEYIWLDGAKPTGKIRSKTRLLSIPQVPKIDDFPEWSFDGSSTRTSLWWRFRLFAKAGKFCFGSSRKRG